MNIFSQRGPMILRQSDFSSSGNFSSAIISGHSPKKFSIKKFIKNSRYLPFIVVILLVTVVAAVSINGVLSKSSPTSAVAQSQKTVSVNKALKEQPVNKTFLFPLNNQVGKKVSEFSYTIQSVELRDQIVIKGQPATALKGRVFLIINLKITNNYNKAISINSRDFLRLVVNNSTEKLAADIHNDPVEVQAISTKYTRVGLAINESDKNLVLQIGEITGKKELIQLNLP